MTDDSDATRVTSLSLDLWFVARLIFTASIQLLHILSSLLQYKCAQNDPKRTLPQPVRLGQLNGWGGALSDSVLSPSLSSL